MSRIRPEQSKAKLRDAELAEAERQLLEAHQQLAAMKAEIDRSYRLLEETEDRPRKTKFDRADGQFDGFASSALGSPSAERMIDAG
jgi:multidrug resistance efflux pump